jgi:tetratricopeptide (TPR) repeat protein
MFMTLQRFRIPTIILGSLLFVAWSLFSRSKKNRTELEEMYTVQDFSQDASKIYCDLGLFAQKRGDFKTAIKFYQIALSHKDNYQDAVSHLKLCLDLEQTGIAHLQ